MGVAVNSVDACLFWLSQTIAVTLRIQEVFSGCVDISEVAGCYL